MPKNVFASPIAGQWYPAAPDQLKNLIGSLLPELRPAPVTNVCAILVPHAGYQYSGRVAAQAYTRLDTNAFDRVIVLGPSHSVSLPNRVSIPEADAIRTPLGTLVVDTALVAALRRSPLVTDEPRAHLREHSDQIQLPLLQTVFGDRIRIVTIVVGQLDRASSQAFATLLRPLFDARTLVVISSDFTHYGPNFDYVPFTRNVPQNIEALDRKVFARIAAVDPAGFREVMDETEDTVCGRYPIALLLDLLPAGASVQEVAYDTSGRQLNDWNNSVSYFSALAIGDWRQPPRPVPATDTATAPLDDDDRRQLLKLARATLDYAVKHHQAPTIEETGVTLRPGMKQIMGGFVTLNIHDTLRGCIGEITPRRAIWKVVREQAVNAALHDSRFEPVTPVEVGKITIEISALTPPHPVASYKDIVIGRHGMTLSKNGRSAVFLPQVAPEQGWDLPTTLSYLARKAGLPGDAWKEGASFTVFEAQVFHE